MDQETITNDKLPASCLQMLFKTFCSICDRIVRKSTRQKKVELLQKLLDKYRHDDVYPLIRFLLPRQDLARGAYGVKETNLAKMYVRVLCLPSGGDDALKLLNFKAPPLAGTGVGDFGEVAYYVLQTKCGEGSKLTLTDVDAHLDNLARLHAEHNPRGVDEELASIILKMSAEEQKWFIRLLLKDIPLGIGLKATLSAYHPDAVELYDYSSSLRKVCSTLKDRSVRLNEIEVAIFEAFKPMLSERLDVSKLKLTKEHYVDTKLDGERFQIHYKDGKFQYFSRNGFDFTSNFGEDISSGHFTSALSKQLSNDVTSLILDGEMMGWNTKRKIFGTKAQNFDVKNLRVGNIIQPCFCVFDVLLYNNQVITNRPLEERLRILESVFTPLEGVIVGTPRSTVKTTEEALAALNRGIDNHEEGIILKDPLSVYKPNSRNGGWYKVKPEYTKGAMVELDLLIVGGYYGERRHRGMVSHFLVGLADKDNSYVALSKIGSGCSNEELYELSDKLSAHWQKYRPQNPPEFLKFGKEKPDLWIKPDVSVIVQVKATEVMPSDLFKLGCTLRFPRIEKIRYDKPWVDCLSVDEFIELKESNDGKLTAGHISGDQPGPSRKRKVVTRVFKEPSHLKVVELETVSVKKDLFEDKEICVMTGNEEHSKEDIEKQILLHGGKVTVNPTSQTYCVVAGKINVRVKNIVSVKKHNVIKVPWIFNSIQQDKLLDWQVEDFHSITPKTAFELASRCEDENELECDAPKSQKFDTSA